MRTLFVFALMLAVSSVANAVEWVQVSPSDEAGSANCMLPDPAHDRLIFGTGDGYRIYYPLTDEWLIREGSYVTYSMSLLAHPTDPLFLLAGYYGAFFNGWIEDHYGLVVEGPAVLNNGDGAIMGMGRLPGNDAVLFACAMSGESAPGGLYAAIDGGQSWTNIHGFYPSDATCLTITPDGDLLVGLRPPGVARGSDAGEAWGDATGDMPLAPEGYIKVIAVDPADPQHIYALQTRYFYEAEDPAHGVYETLDGGLHWTQILAGDVYELTMHPENAGTLVALRVPDILLSSDGGETWLDFRGDLPAGVGGARCAILTTDERIYLAAGDDGLWATNANPTAVEASPAAGFALAAHPNPFNPKTTLAFSLREAGAADLRIIDAQGRSVRSLLAGVQRPAGLQSLTWDGRDDAGRALPSGLYFARLIAGEERLSRKLLMLK